MGQAMLEVILTSCLFDRLAGIAYELCEAL